MESNVRLPRTGDFIWVDHGTFPGYPFCIFAVAGFIEFDNRQICVHPPTMRDHTIWVHFDPNIHIVIKDSQLKDLIEALYGRI